MNYLKGLIIVLSVVLLNSCTNLPATFQKTEHSKLIFSPNKWEFPKSIAGLKRAEIYQYDKSGKNCSVAYNYKNLIAATVYVYPPEGSLSEEEVMVSALIDNTHKSGKPQKRMPVVFNKYKGIRLGHVYGSVFNYRHQLLRSQTLLFQIKGYSLKFRISYPAQHAQELEPRINQFLADYPWP
jgi:hypothetical protein